MTDPKTALKLIKAILPYIDAKRQCKAVIKKDYLVEYGRTGRKTWAIEITTNADQYYVAYVYPSPADDTQNAWSADTGWMPRPNEPRYQLQTLRWSRLNDAIQTALTKIAETIVIDALLLEDVTGESHP